MNEPNKDQDLVSIGKAAADMQQMPDAIRKAAHDLGIAPVMCIDGRQFFARSDLDRIGRVIAGASAAMTLEMRRRLH